MIQYLYRIKIYLHGCKVLDKVSKGDATNLGIATVSDTDVLDSATDFHQDLNEERICTKMYFRSSMVTESE